MNQTSLDGSAPKINLITLIKRTLAKIFVTAGIPETEASVRMVSTCLVNIAAEYVKAVGDDPKHIEALFHGFLTGTEEEQKAAVKAFGEAFAPKPENTEEKTEPESLIISP